MVLKKLVLSIIDIFDLRGQRQVKGPPTFEVLKLTTTSEGAEEAGGGAKQSDAAGGPGSGEADHQICCVCLSGLKEGEAETRLLPCLHEFHRECIDKWWSGCRRTCPLCRFLVEDHVEKFERGEALTEEMFLWFSSFHVAGF